MVSSTVSDFLELHRAGKIRVIATSGEVRTADLPDVPTFKESGIDIVGSGWYGMFAPAHTPPDVVARLNTALVAALALPELKTRISGFGLTPTGTSPAQLAAIQRVDADKWGPIVKASGFVAD
jgi:tripartite-type tricarboxylate transporter receptor subunit TctC